MMNEGHVKKIGDLAVDVAESYGAQQAAITEEREAAKRLLRKAIELATPALPAICDRRPTSDASVVLAVKQKPDESVVRLELLETGSFIERCGFDVRPLEPDEVLSTWRIRRILVGLRDALMRQNRDKATAKAIRSAELLEAIVTLLSDRGGT